MSGHGPAVAVFGEKLRELMQRCLRDLEQVALMRDLNQAVREELGDGHYATMVAVGWHGRRGLAVMTNAGHPPPLWYRASRDEWTWLETQREASESDWPVCRLACLPTSPTTGWSSNRNRATLWCSTATASPNPSVRAVELGRDGLMKMVRALDSSSAEALGTRLVAALRAFRGADEPLDDETIIAMRRNDI